MMPQRIQRKRTKGWKMPPNTVYVGRPTKWGNPYQPNKFDTGYGKVMSLSDCINAYEALVNSGECGGKDLSELRGKDLACWCPLDTPCHADVLLRLVNPSPSAVPGRGG